MITCTTIQATGITMITTRTRMTTTFPTTAILRAATTTVTTRIETG